MFDRELGAWVVATLEAAFVSQGMEVAVLFEDQAESVGAVDGPALYYRFVGTTRYGWAHKSQSLDPDDETVTIYREEAQMGTAIQLRAIFKQRDADTTGPSAQDLAEIAKALLCSEPVKLALKAAGLGLLPPGPTRNPVFSNENGQRELGPLFDFTLTFKRVTITKVPSAFAGNLEIHSV